MEIISSKATVSELVAVAVRLLSKGDKAFVGALHDTVLNNKIRFPLLEFAAVELYNIIPEEKQIGITDKVIALHTIGGNALVGMLLQKRLSKHFKESIDKAAEYIIEGDEWYVCDIIGERVMGYALLTMPEKTLPILKKYAKHDDKWIVRCIGVAGHYAIKKGLKKQYVEELFQLLLTLRDVTEFHTKKGVGWAAKTTAKFHPEIIDKYRAEIESEETRAWFINKINIGLDRTWKYAHSYTD
jgi:hypothetical protein